MRERIEIAQRVKDPVSEFAAAHWRASAVNRAQQRVRISATGSDEFEVALAGGVDEHDVVGLTDAEAPDVLDTAAELELQVLQDAARRTKRGAEPLAPKSIERLHFEMLREAVLGLIEQKQVTLHRLRTGRAAERLNHLALIVAVEDFAGLESLQLIGELGGVLELGDFELAGGVIDIGEAEFLPLAKHGGEVVRAVRVEQVEVIDRARAEDLRHRPLDDLARCRLRRLLGDGDAFAGLDELRDVALRRMMRHAAHRHRVAFRQRHIQDGRGDLRVLEEQLIKVPQPEKQQHILRKLPPDGEVLLHHGSGGGVGHGQGWSGASGNGQGGMKR